MKCLPIFLTVLVLCLLLNFLFGAWWAESFWMPVVILALGVSLALYVYIQQSDKLEELEKRIKELEEKKEP